MLDNLVAMDALQSVNRIDESLLNSKAESQLLTESSDKEIFEAVIGAIEACENLELNGGENVKDDGSQEPCPTHHDVVKAVSTISKYLDNCKDSIAHKLEVLLSSFN